MERPEIGIGIEIESVKEKRDLQHDFQFSIQAGLTLNGAARGGDHL